MSRRSLGLGLLLIFAAPLLLLGESIFGDSVLFSYDPAQFTPKQWELNDQDYQEVSYSESNQLVTEIPAVFTPELSYSREEIAEGRFPGWNPYVRFGTPLFANGLIAIVHPKNAALLLGWDPIRGLALGAYVSIVFAGLLTFGLMRHLGVGAAAATFAAIGFELGGTMTANLHFYMRMDAIIAMPGMVWAVLCILRARGLKERALPTAGLMVLTALNWLSGFPPYAVLSMLLCGMVSVFGLGRIWATEGLKRCLATAGFLLAGVCIGSTLAAVQLGPMFAFFPESAREFTLNPGHHYGDGFGLFGFPALLFPEIYGLPTDVLVPAGNHPWVFQLSHYRGLDGALVLPQYNFVEYTIFAGSLALPLALLGLLRGRGPAPVVAVACTLVFLAMSMRPPEMEEIPLLGSTPPFRFAMPLALTIPVLAGLGMQQVVDQRNRRLTLACGAGSILLALGAAIFAETRPLEDYLGILESVRTREWPANVLEGETPVSLETVKAQIAGGQGAANWYPVMLEFERRTYMALLRGALAFALAGAVLVLAATSTRRRVLRSAIACGFLLTIGELWWLGEQSVAHRPYPKLAGGTRVHEFLTERQEEMREEGGILIARAAKGRGPTRQQPYPHALPASTTLRQRFRDLNDYAFIDGNSHKLFHKVLKQRPNQPLDEFMYRDVWPRSLPDDERLDHPLWDVLGVDTILADEPLDHAGPLATEPFVYETTPPRSSGTFYVYDRPNALPRAFVFHEEERHADDDAILAALGSKDLQPRRAVHLHRDEAKALDPYPLEPRGDTDRKVRFASEIAHEIKLEVGDGPAGRLYLADTFLSGWTAEVDGEEVPIVRSHLCMRAVPVPAGACTVVFRYEPPGLKLGLVLSGLSLLAVLALSVLGLIHRLRRTRDDRADGALPE